MDWRVKALIQKGLSSAPGGLRLNSRLQHFLGGLRNFDGHIANRVDNWTTSMGYLADVDFRWRGARLMEIGTGWHPVLPLCFALAGADSIATFDIVRLLDGKATFRILDCLEKRVSVIADLSGESPDSVRAKLQEYRQTKNIGELLTKCHIEYFAPADGCASGLESDSIDLIYSNSVLEHVPQDVIRSLMEESYRVLKPGGLIMHNVACNDHYASFDKSISFANFLKYEEQEWRLWNNSIQFQNRLRAPQFIELAVQAGFEVIRKATHVRPGTLEALANMTVASQFARFSMDEIAATTVDFIGRKP